MEPQESEKIFACDLVAFDLDNTLAESKQPLDKEMTELLGALIKIKKVAVISGASFHQLEDQVIKYLEPFKDSWANLFFLPTSGASLYEYRAGGWQPVYDNPLSPEELAKIHQAFAEALPEAGIETPPKIYGVLIEDRGPQVTFSGLGSEAPLAEKKIWDPDRSKQERLAEILRRKLPEFSVRVGGISSVDVNKRGIDKAYGLDQLAALVGIGMEQMIYVGDALFPGGNDEVAIALGERCLAVAGVAETKELIRQLLTVDSEKAVV